MGLCVFGALQILKHGYVLAQAGPKSTNYLHNLFVVFMGPVGEVETHYIHTGSYQLLNPVR